MNGSRKLSSIEFSLLEIEMLLAVCGRAAQTDDTLGPHFKSAKAKLQKERTRMLTVHTQTAVGELMEKAARVNGMEGPLDITVTR